MIDGHIHYASMLNPRKLNELIRRENLRGVALQCIPKADDFRWRRTPLRLRAQAKVPVYVFGGLRRELYRLSEPELSDALVREAERLMDRGCAGIKMLEGKPQIRKAHPIPDFDRPVWEPYTLDRVFPGLFSCKRPGRVLGSGEDFKARPGERLAVRRNLYQQ